MRIVSGVEMPAINLASPGVLHGDIESQLAALWEGLNTGDFQVPTIGAVQSLTAINQKGPIIFRDIFEHGQGDTTSRSFAVGFPNGHSLLLDLDRMSFRRWWFGDFAYEQTRGKTWYWQTAGTTLVDDKESPPLLALLQSGRILLPHGPHQAVTSLKEWHREEGRVVLETSVLFDQNQRVDVRFLFVATSRGLRVSIQSDKMKTPGELICLLPPIMLKGRLPWDRAMSLYRTRCPPIVFPGMVPAHSAAYAFSSNSAEITWEFDTAVGPLSTIKPLPIEPTPRLFGEMALPNLRTTVVVEVTYEIVSTQGIKRTIQLRQADMFALLYQITNRLEPVTSPAKLWSFDHADCKGGPLHENFPAAGFRTQDGVTVGLLTDAGFRNQWSRIIRRMEPP